MPGSPEMEVPNMPASPEMEVPNMDSSSDNDDNDGLGDDEDNPNIVPDQNLEPSMSIENYIGDINNLDDFANHWVWQIQDTGASFTPFTGTPGLLLDPPNTKPADFFNLLLKTRCMNRLHVRQTHMQKAKCKVSFQFSINLFLSI